MRSEAYFLHPARSQGRRARRPADGRSTSWKASSPTPSRSGSRCRTCALGRPGFAEAPTRHGPSGRGARPEYSAELAGRLGQARGRDLEAAHGQVQLLSISRDSEEERSLNPMRCFQDKRRLVRRGPGPGFGRTSAPSGSRGSVETLRFATRGSGIFRLPAEFDIEPYRDRPPWQIGDLTGEARIEVGGDTAWWVERTYGEHGPRGRRRLRDRVSSPGQLASWIVRPGRARLAPSRPPELRREVARALRLVRDRHEGAPKELAAEAKPREQEELERGPPARRAGAVCVLQAFASPTCLNRCGESNEAVVDAIRPDERFHIPPDELEGICRCSISNFGGGLLSDLRGAVPTGRFAWTRSCSATRSALPPR